MLSLCKGKQLNYLPGEPKTMRKKSPQSTECYAPSERQQEGRPWREENSAAVTKLQLHHKLQTDLQ
jgi:hypothetical protein